MFLNQHDPEICIELSPAVLEHLKNMAPGALKVYIALCAHYKGKPFSASTSEIGTATGLKNRSVIYALNDLRKYQLIADTSGTGNQPNKYDIPLPKQTTTPGRNDATTFSTPGLGTPSPPPPPKQETTPAPTATTSNTQPLQAAGPAKIPQTTVLELIATSYRPLNAQEWDQVKKAYPDEVVLLQKLDRLKQNGGVAAETTNFDFFMAALSVS